ncbi:MAG: tRNA 5-methoxyuridine(34)/uridine 5-oxyacetic acid(34) synthase CmoB [Pseudomonadota bacterium]
MSRLESQFEQFFASLSGGPLEPWRASLPARVTEALAPGRHGHLPHWRAALEGLPEPVSCETRLNAAAVTVDCPALDGPARAALEAGLRALMPWRKGPFELCGLRIDTEWRSDMKWARVAPHLSPLAGRRVLDVGCGSGYHLWRMLGAGAALAVGIDPTSLFVLQFAAVRHLAGPAPAAVLPFTLEELPRLPVFDTVFSMGVLYHRRSPLDHLRELRECLRPGGELVLETLVVEGDVRTVLMPEDRYAMMRNVWFIPSPAALLRWLDRLGFVDARVVDLTPTTVEEQRATDWGLGQSLADFLDPSDPSRTVEGYPAPLRATFIARAPGG